MESEHGESGQAAAASPHPLLSFAGPMAVSLAIIEVAFDWGTWIELNVSVLYGLPLVFAAVARNRRLLWLLACALIGVTFAVYVAQVPVVGIAESRAFLLDRVLSALSVLLSAGILDAWLQSLQVRDSQGQAIAQQNARLEAINAELVKHEDEISRKNQELEQHRSQIEEISSRKTQMLASISHDIRSPMQAIVLMAEVMRRASEQPEQVTRIPALAQRLQANAASVVDFLSEVIDVASFDTGRITINNSEFDLGELMAVQRQRLLPMAESKGLSLVADPCDLRLRTDRVKLGRVIANLVGNAIKFTDAGSVTITSGMTEKDQVFIRVADTGRGIKPEDLDRIFVEFAQVDQSSPAQAGGWGLGLAISRRLVNLLGGEIHVQSELQKGSVFTVSLPPSTLVIDEESAIKCFLGRSG